MNTIRSKFCWVLGMTFLCFFSQLSYAKNWIIKRTIHNNSGIPWVIVGQPCSKNSVAFNSSNHSQACDRDSSTCLLQPGYTTEVRYSAIQGPKDNQIHCGNLVFTDGTSRIASVRYRTDVKDIQHSNLLLDSSYNYIVIDTEKNITLN